MARFSGEALTIRALAYLLPDAAGDQVHGKRPQILGQAFDAEHHQAAAQGDVRMAPEQPAGQTAAREHAVRNQRRTTRGAGHTERSVGQHCRSVRLV